MRNLFITLCLLSLVLFFFYVPGRSFKVTHGFASYYTFSRMMLVEKDFSKAYDTSYFNIKIHGYGIDGVRDKPNNLPPSAFLFAPLALLEPAEAKAAWVILSVIFYFISISLLLKTFDVKSASNAGLLLIIISFLFLPVYHGLALGQVYTFLLMLFSLSLYGLKRHNLWLISIPLALMIVLKGYGIFPLAALILMKKWKAVFAVLTITVLIIIVTLPFIGLNTWIVYFNDVLLKMGGSEFASYTSYQTINSFVKHIIVSNSSSIILLFILAGLFVYILKRKYTGNYLLFYCSFAVLNVIFAPLAEDYHYVLLLPLVFGLGKTVFDNYNSMKIQTAVFIMSLVLLSIPYNYKGLNNASFPLILLAYPVLYGGILMLCLSLKKEVISANDPGI